MHKTPNDDIYGSGLNREDWGTLRNILFEFLYAKDPSRVEMSQPPEHLANHPLIQALKLYKSTGEDRYLDQAGRLLVPGYEKPFDWYLVVSKS